MSKKSARGSARANAIQHKMARNLDDLEAFENFQAEILPELQKLIRKGASADEIYKKFQAHAAARAVTIALTDGDTAKRLAAIKEVLDRAVGKPTETKKVEHKFDKLRDEELDALIMSEAEGTQPEDDVH